MHPFFIGVLHLLLLTIPFIRCDHDHLVPGVKIRALPDKAVEQCLGIHEPRGIPGTHDSAGIAERLKVFQLGVLLHELICEDVIQYISELFVIII